MTTCKRPIIVFTSVCFLLTLASLDLSVVNVALPTIAQVMHVSMSGVQWVILIYGLFTSMFMIFMARVSECIGQGRTYILGLALFFIGALVSGFAQNILTVIIGRAMFGIAGACAFPVSTSLALMPFAEEKRTAIMGYLMTVIGVGTAAGPLLGGVLLHLLSWRWVFLINAPIALAAYVIYLLSGTKVASTAKFSELNLKNSALFAVAIFLFVLPINEVSNWGFVTWKFFVPILASIFVFFAFAYAEKRSRHPMVNWQEYSIKSYWSFCMQRGVISYVFMSVLFVAPLYLENINGLYHFKVAEMLMFATLAMGCTSPFVGRLTKHVGLRLILIAGFVLLTAGAGLVLLQKDVVVYATYLPGLILIGVAVGLLAPSVSSATLNFVATESVTVSVAIVIGVAFVFGGLGVAITGGLLRALSFHKLTDLLSSQHLLVHNIPQQTLVHLASGVRPLHMLARLETQANFNRLLPIFQSAFHYAYTVAFVLSLLLAIIGLLMSCLTKLYPPNSKQL